MIKQKLIQVNMRDARPSKYFSRLEEDIKHSLDLFFEDLDLNYENLNIYLTKFPFLYRYVTVVNSNGHKLHSLGQESPQPEEGIYYNSYKSTKSTFLGFYKECEFTREEMFSFYLQNFLDELNEKDAEIIQITPIINYGSYSRSHTSGILVVYKENKKGQE